MSPHRFFFFILSFLEMVVLLLPACTPSSPEDDDSAGDDDSESPPLALTWDLPQGRFQVSRGSEILLSLAEGGVVAQQVDAAVEQSFGAYNFHDTVLTERIATTFTAESDGSHRALGEDGQGVALLTVLDAPGAWDGEVGARLALRGELEPSFVAEAQAQGRVPRLLLRFACQEGDRFLGLGAQTDATDHRGHTVPVWVSEQGIGKSDEDEPPEDWFLRGARHSSYFPVPLFHDPSGDTPFAFLVDETSRSTFDFCDTDDSSWTVGIEGEAGTVKLFAASDGDGLARNVTEIIGRPPPLPDWAFGVWIDAVGGQERVAETAIQLRQEGIPASALWTEDWVGAEEGPTGYHLRYNWYTDTTLYPDLPGLAADLAGQGFRFLGYVNPFLTEETPTWDDALFAGAAVTDGEGAVLTFTGPLFDECGLVDPWTEAGDGFLTGVFDRMTGEGFSGWMADYAEWLPVETEAAPGSGRFVHNAYPGAWQEANLAFLAAAAPDGEPPVFFARSGFTGSAATSPVVWAGDQQTSFGTDDGLPTVVPLGLNLGLSGVSAYAHDIAGYSSVGVDPSTEELFRRWTALGALTPVMRTHHGAYAEDNWAWNTTPETIAFFRSFAVLHMQLLPLWRGLHQYATETGIPAWRHPGLWYRDNSDALAATDWFLLGERIAVYPIVNEGAEGRTCSLPGDSSSRWVPFLGGEMLPAGAVEVTASAWDSSPLSTLPLFVRGGTLVPMRDASALTAVPGEFPGVPSSANLPSFSQVYWYLGEWGEAQPASPGMEGFSASQQGEVANDLSFQNGAGEPLPACPESPEEDAVECQFSEAGEGNLIRLWIHRGGSVATLEESPLLTASVAETHDGEGVEVVLRGSWTPL